MSLSLSLNASTKTPTPPSSAKMNGSAVSPPPGRHQANHLGHNQQLYSSTPPSNRGNVTTSIGGNVTPALMGTPIPANLTINSTKPLLDLSRGSIHLSPNNTTRRQPLILSGSPTTLNGGHRGPLDDNRDQDLLGGFSPTSTNPLNSMTPVKRNGVRCSSSECQSTDTGIYQTLASLALLCLLSLLMSFLALFFLQKVGPPVVPTQLSRTTSHSSDGHVEKRTSARVMNGNGNNNALQPKMSGFRVVISSEEYFPVYQVSVALSTLTVALDLCCLFVCCIQFLFAIKLLKTPNGEQRTNKFLKRSSTTRVISIGGFFLSIPIFFTGVILFTFIHFQEVPAIATSVAIGIGIVFCGVASVQNVYLWQWEKTRASREFLSTKHAGCNSSRLHESTCSTTAPDVTVHTMELSTLV